MTWMNPTTEQWMRIVVVALFVVGIVCGIIMVLVWLNKSPVSPG